MKNRNNIIIIVYYIMFVHLLIQGCSITNYMKMDAIESPGQSIVYNDGKKTLVSQKKNFVTLAPFRELNAANAKTSFILFVQNLGENPLDISNQNVSVTFEGNTEDWISRKINVQSYEDIMLEIQAEETKQRRAASLAAIAGAMSTQSAATSTSTTYNTGGAYGTYKANTYGTYANNPYSMNTTGNLQGSYSSYSTTKTYDPAKAQVLANQNNEIFRNNLNRIAAQSQSMYQMVDALYMKAQTVMPGQTHGGLIVTDTRTMDHTVEGKFKVIISLGDEEHTFSINRTYHSSQP